MMGPYKETIGPTLGLGAWSYLKDLKDQLNHKIWGHVCHLYMDFNKPLRLI